MTTVHNKQEQAEYRKKNKHSVRFSESYEVKYTMQNPNTNYWEPHTDLFFTECRVDHDTVIAKWKKDHKKDKTRFVSVSYQ